MILMEGSLSFGVQAYPFLQTPSGGGGVWTVGDPVYVTAAGLYDNAAVGAELPYGEVIEVVGLAASATALRVLFRQ